MVSELPGIGRRVRELRTAKGMTQQQLAVAAGLSISLVSQIEQGTNADPKVSTVRALARVLEVKLADLAENGETLTADQTGKQPKAAPATPPAEPLEQEGKKRRRKQPAEPPAGERPPSGKKPRARKRN